jgi:hypothetical protein
MSQENLSNAKKAEALFFDRVADIRAAAGHIPVEADLRRATRIDPKSSGDLRIDPKMSAILDRGASELMMQRLATRSDVTWIDTSYHGSDALSLLGETQARQRGLKATATVVMAHDDKEVFYVYLNPLPAESAILAMPRIIV